MPEVAGDGCDVCVLGKDGDEAEFYNVIQRTARKPQQCYECGETIQPGQSYERTAAKWYGESVEVFKTCSLCVEIRTKFSCGQGWMFGSIWEELEEGLFDRLTHGCLTGMSVAAREKVLSRWRKWKGLE